jgi:hypothetical protein
MVRAVHNMRLGDGWERQRGDTAVGGADRLIFDYCRHVYCLLATLKNFEVEQWRCRRKVVLGVTDFIVGRISLSDNLPCVGGVDCRCRRR